ncbi:nitrate- and nitrite sensing domain-containing protein [Streptomyces sp. 7R007]
MSPRTGARRRVGSIRLSLILLALVPGITLAAMWGVTTTQMFSEGLRLRTQTELSRSTGAMGTDATLALQQERSLSAVWLTSPKGSRAALDAQRKKTDAAVAKLVDRADEIQQAPARVKDRLYSVVASVSSLEYYRGQVDDPTDITGAQALDQYTSIIDDQIHAFQELSQVDDGDLTSQAGPLVALEHAAELVSEEDTQLTLAGPAGSMDEKTWAQFAQLVNTRRWLVENQIVPLLTGNAKTQTERILQGADWQTLESIEDQVLAARTAAGADGRIALPDVQKQWRAALIKVSDQYGALVREQTRALLDRSADKAHSLLLTAASLSAGGLVALLLCVGMSWRITRSLSRRLRGLREATLRLAEERLPDVVERLDRGEKVDVDLATPPLDYGRDELGQVAQAFNTAQRTAVHTAVELADTRRGFQKVILGIARQSQNLVNLQLTKLDALEREHSDPDVLKGLYELDSTASQLRRYEENLVIISGEQPRRSWREPVALIDILRSAVGEVAEYARVEVHTDEDVYVAPPAVADVIHLLAELIDNATVYSPPPSPVGVRAAMVAKGLAVEIEDRGLGMSEEDYAAFNVQLAVEPQFDVVALADDLRLGMFVIARLATRHGIAVTLRPSPYGGTTAIVLLPHDIVVREAPPREPARDGATPPARMPRATPLAAQRRIAVDEGEHSRLREHAEADGAGTEASDHAHGAQTAAGSEDPGAAGVPEGTGVEAGAAGHADTDGIDRAVAEDAPEAGPAEGPHGAAGSGRAGSSRDTGAPADTDAPADAVTSTSTDAVTGTSTEAGTGTEAHTGAATDADTGTGHSDPSGTPTGPPAAADSARFPHSPGTSPAPTRPPGLARLPRRVPQSSLAAELREEAGAVEEDVEEFTAEQAASSLAGFQRGTLRARDEDAGTSAPDSHVPRTPPADS